MHQHAVNADGVVVEPGDLKIVHPHTLDANRQAGDRRRLARPRQEVVAQTQPPRLNPSAHALIGLTIRNTILRLRHHLTLHRSDNGGPAIPY